MNNVPTIASMRPECRVLVVEPEDMLRELLTAVLESSFDVLPVSNGEAMEEALNQSRFHVAIINMELRAANVLALAERAVKSGCGVILIPDRPEQFIEARSAGHFILLKPFHNRRVLDLVDCARTAGSSP